MPTGLGDEQLWISPTNDNTGTSTAFQDQSGNGNNGTASGTAVVADTSEGGTYAFNLATVAHNVSLPADLGISGDTMSISLWVNNSSSNVGSAVDMWFGAYDSTNANSNLFIYQFEANLRYADKNTSPDTTITYGWSASPASAWRHITVVADGAAGEYRAYENGVLLNTQSSGGSDMTIQTSLNWFIGSGNGFQGAIGKVDDLRAYGRVLTQAEITHLAEARGIEGPAPAGLGDEQLWLCPSINDSANDISGNGNNGTYNGGMGTVADTGSGGTLAYDFDGIDDTITTASAVQFGADSFSISLWMYSNANFNNSPFGNYATGSTSEWVTVTTQGGRDIFLRLDDGSTNTSTVAQEYNNLTWYTHTFVVSRITDGSGSIVYYRDGVEITNASIPVGYGSIDSNSVFSIGNGLGGMMDDIRVYKRSLTQAEVVHLASSRGVEGPPPVGLGDEQLWLCPSLSDSANDISGNGNNGTLVSGTAIVSDTGSGGTKSFESYTTATDRVDIPAGVFTDGNDVSLSLWVKNKQTSAGSSVRHIFRTTNNDLRLYAFQSNYRGLVGGVFAQDNTATLSTTEYYHYALNYDNATSSLELFRNGVSVATASGAAATTLSGTLDLLQNSVAFVDDVRSYNRKLTTAEIVHLASGRGTTGTPRAGLGSESLWVSPTLTGYDAFDITGNGNTALIDGTVPVVEDTTGYESFQTDNTAAGTDYVYFDSPTGTTDPAAATIAFWAESNFSGSYAPVGGFCTSGFNDLRFFIARKATTGEVRIYRKTTSSGVAVDDFTMPNGTTDFTDGNMHHWCLVFEGGKNKLYFDGAFIGESATALSDNLDLGSTNFSLGSQDGRTTGASASNYDDIRFYDSALTSAEVFHLSTSRGVQGTSDIPAGLGTEAGWWMPTYSEDNPSVPNIASSTVTQYNIVPTLLDSSDFVVDTDNGGEWAGLSGKAGGENRLVTGIRSQVFDTGSWTMMGWVKSTSTSTQYLYDTSGGWTLRLDSGVFSLLGGVSFTTTTTYPLNQWFHFAFSVDSNRTNYKFYLDGVLEETATSSQINNNGTDAIYICAQQNNTFALVGRWDDFRVFDTQISDADVATLASSRGGGGSAPPSSAFYNPFKNRVFQPNYIRRIG